MPVLVADLGSFYQVVRRRGLTFSSEPAGWCTVLSSLKGLAARLSVPMRAGCCASGNAMSCVVQIIATEPVRYSLDGMRLWEFAPGEVYEVPDHVATGMFARRWAQPVTGAELNARHSHPALRHEGT